MCVKHRSIRVDIRTSLYTLTLFLILPVAISLIVMLYSADSYQRSISRMENRYLHHAGHLRADSRVYVVGGGGTAVL